MVEVLLSMKNDDCFQNEKRVLKLGNIFGYNGSSTNFGGNVYDIRQMSPSVLTFPGGGCPLVIIIKKHGKQGKH